MKRAVFPTLLIGLLVCWHAQQSAAANTPAPVTCDNLTVTLSDDKNFYIFTASASGDTNTITSYTFDFGDRQSYTVKFGASSKQDRHTASATHTYQDPGTPTATVHVHTKRAGKAASVSSPGCQASVTVGQSPTTLPRTGATGATSLFIGSAALGALAHALRIRRLPRAQ